MITDAGIPDVSKLSIGVDYHCLLWQELNKNFPIFVMAVGQKLSYCDYDVTAGHAELAAKNTSQLVDHALACATTYSSKGSVSRMWEGLLDEKGPKAGPDEQSAFQEAKKALYKDYNKNEHTALYEDYLIKSFALKQTELQIQRELKEKDGDQWKVNFNETLNASKEYCEFQQVAELVEPHLDAIKVWQHGPLVHQLNRLKQGSKLATHYICTYIATAKIFELGTYIVT